MSLKVFSKCNDFIMSLYFEINMSYIYFLSVLFVLSHQLFLVVQVRESESVLLFPFGSWYGSPLINMGKLL